MKVLSIDFDYFVKATPEAMALFPDGGREFSGLDSVVWASNYAHASVLQDDVLLNGATVDTQSLLAVAGIVMTQNANTKVMITDSHRHAYKFIKENCKRKVKADIYNVDFHHDTFDNADREVNCGNWLRRLIEEQRTGKVYWTSRAGSVKRGKMPEVQYLSFRELPKNYDLIFICRSGWWTPPHLDHYFTEKLVLPLLKQ